MGLTQQQAEELQARVKKNGMLGRALDLAGTPTASPILGESDNTVVLVLDPIGAPRMTKSDRWRVDPNHPDPRKRQRPRVARYFAWRKQFVRLCQEHNWTLQAVLRVHFDVAMPTSWSKKKKAEMEGLPHQQKPDYDNLAKSIGDAFGVDDGFVWDARITKRWAYTGKITLWR